MPLSLVGFRVLFLQLKRIRSLNLVRTNSCLSCLVAFTMMIQCQHPGDRADSDGQTGDTKTHKGVVFIIFFFKYFFSQNVFMFICPTSLV